MDKWQKAAEILSKGGVVVVPSDSVYGIAALAKNQTAIEKLYGIKKREPNKPSLLIVSSLEQAKQLVEFPLLAEELAQKYWPGGLTLVLTAKEKNLSPLIYGELGEHQTLAIRIPSQDKLIWLAEKIGPFILPSANLSGQQPALTLEDLDPKLVEQVDFVLKEPTDNNPVSTLVDARGGRPIILRQGAVKII